MRWMVALLLGCGDALPESASYEPDTLGPCVGEGTTALDGEERSWTTEELDEGLRVVSSTQWGERDRRVATSIDVQRWDGPRRIELRTDEDADGLDEHVRAWSWDEGKPTTFEWRVSDVYDLYGTGLLVRESTTYTPDGELDEITSDLGGDGTVDQRTVHLWEDGRLVRRVAVDLTEPALGIATFEYLDPAPGLDHVERTDFDRDEIPELTVARAYDDRGDLVSEATAYRSGLAYTAEWSWDADGRVLSEAHFSDVGRSLTTWEYDELGLIARSLRETDDDGDGRVEHLSETTWRWTCAGG